MTLRRRGIPITIAALGPKNVELTAEIADHLQDLYLAGKKVEAIAAVPDTRTPAGRR